MNKLLRCAVTALLLYWVGRDVEWRKVAEAFARLEHVYWLAAVGLYLLTQAVSAARWQVFARQLGMDRPLRQLTGIYFIGMYFNLFLPTSVGGDVVRAFYLNGRSGRKLRAVAAVLLDRANGLAVLVALAAVAVLCSPVDLPAWIPLSVLGTVLGGCAGVLGLAAVTRWGRLAPQRLEQIRLMWQIVRAPRALATTTVLSLFVQLANVAIVWLVSHGLGLSVPLGYYAVLVPMVSLLTLLPSIGGVGVREKGTALFLAPLGVPADTAVTLSLLWFAVQLTVSALGGLVYLFGTFPRPQAAGTERPGGSETEGGDGPVGRDPGQGREGQLGRAA